VLLPPVAPQVPEAFPTRPPPSKAVVEPVLEDVADWEVPAPEDIPDCEVPVPEEPAVAEDVPAVEVDEPKEAWGIEPPNPKHGAVLLNNPPVEGPAGETPDVAGLTPGDPSSVAPMPSPVGGTGEPGPMPSGEVAPSGEGADGEPAAAEPVCANTGLELKRAATIARINKRIIVGCPFSSYRNLVLGLQRARTLRAFVDSAETPMICSWRPLLRASTDGS
jgi:hypothetical protein